MISVPWSIIGTVPAFPAAPNRIQPCPAKMLCVKPEGHKINAARARIGKI